MNPKKMTSFLSQRISHLKLLSGLCVRRKGGGHKGANKDSLICHDKMEERTCFY